MPDDRKFRLVLDEEACVGHGRCYDLAPDLFGEDERGHSVLKVSIVSGAQEEAARLGAENCPEDALSIVPE